MDAVLAISALVGIIMLVLWVVVWARGRVRRAVREAASLSGLAPEREKADDDGVHSGWTLEEAYRGRIDGVSVLLAMGSTAVPSHVSPVFLSGVLLRAEFEPPLSFSIEVRRNAGAVPSNYAHPDEEFSRRCAVHTENPEAALRLFSSAAARGKTTDFLREGQGSALVDRSGLWTIVFDAQWKGAPAILRRLREMVELVNLLRPER